MNVAIVHDWLVSMGGAERCLEVFCELFPDAKLHTLFYDRTKISSRSINGMDIRTSPLQKLPLAKKNHRYYLPLMPSAVESFDLSGYDLILSSSHCVAKGARKPPHSCHICYCHTPMRYIWNMYGEYFENNRTGFLARAFMPFFVNRLRGWDVRTSANVDFFIANSENVKKRIREYYGRESSIIYPPVDTGFYGSGRGNKKGEYFLVVSRLVPYKRVDLALESFNILGQPLVVIGDGPDYGKLLRMKGPNVRMLKNLSDAEVRDYYANAKALIFPGIEDFGIVPLEAQAAGLPVIAFGQGGALESVVEGVTGEFFSPQTVSALVSAVKAFRPEKFNGQVIKEHALKFTRAVFKSRVREFMLEKYGKFKNTDIEDKSEEPYK